MARQNNPALAAFVLLAASSGARRGEIVALRRRDLNLEDATLSIDRGIVMTDGSLIEQGTKAHQSRRITLDVGTVAVPREHLALMDKQAEGIGVC